MYLVNNVEALYPRINKTYRFDNAENRSVACDPLDDGAAYEMSFVMSKEPKNCSPKWLKHTKKSVKTNGQLS
jgi:hypothetical protein